ncbi:MAG: hypothetical protein FJ087_04760 [Deltaproteobacteria bacterium]|nr:hypothetical protein [Deltaproteobacteria bacterium]
MTVVGWGAGARAADCAEGTKLGDDCHGITYAGCCDGAKTMWCGNAEGDTGPLCGIDCGADAMPSECGWKAAAEFYGCGGEGTDPTGTAPIDCGWSCTPSCDGKQCGDDGCLGDCAGAAGCGEGKFCAGDATCKDCACGDKVCGADECGRPCGTCTDGKWCVDGACVAEPPAECVEVETPGCPGCACEECVCTLDPYCCGKKKDGTPDPDGKWDYLCVAMCGDDCGGADCCRPDCTDAECGDDGCDGSCGTCADAAAVCFKGKCCIPSCTDKECGDDGCGGTCGAAEGCGEGRFCNDLSKCEACTCGDKTCGYDQCYNACGANDGACAEGEYCDPTDHCKACSCDGKVCGGDGCGNPCGTCTDGKGCTPDGQCVEVPAGCTTNYNTGGCDGCACEACVCALDANCCGAEGWWGSMCVQYCSDDCGTHCPEDICMPDCTDVECGTDTCGGTCGACGEKQFCNLGKCADCTCDGKACGDDGCGTSCGECTDGKKCEDGQCVADECLGISEIGCCAGAINKYCWNGLQSEDCGADGCGWDADNGWYGCGGSGTDPNGEYSIDCPECTWGSCEGRECGDNGCMAGVSCGECPAGKTCSPDGKCLSGYPEACLGEGEPSADSCEGSVESYEGCCDNKTRVVWCDEGKLYCLDCMASENPESQQCGWGSEEQPFYICGGTGEDPTGTAPLECAEGPVCTPECTDKECGNGGCADQADACGKCAAGKVCSAEFKCVDCAPNCLDKECGDDGCGGKCGECGAGEACEAGKCKCVPQCTGKVCGDDGCGATCGTCKTGETCEAGKCVGTTTPETGTPDVPATDAPKTDTPAGDVPAGDTPTGDGTGGGSGGGGGCTAGAGATAIPFALLLSSLGLAVLRRRD